MRLAAWLSVAFFEKSRAISILASEDTNEKQSKEQKLTAATSDTSQKSIFPVSNAASFPCFTCLLRLDYNSSEGSFVRKHVGSEFRGSRAAMRKTPVSGQPFGFLSAWN